MVEALERTAPSPRYVLMSGLGYPLRTALVGSEKVDTTQPEYADTLIVYGTDVNRNMITLSLPLPEKSTRAELLINTNLQNQGQLVKTLSRGLQAAWNMLTDDARAERDRDAYGTILSNPPEGLYVKLIELGKKGCPELDGPQAD